jgi:hypothetical protein
MLPVCTLETHSTVCDQPGRWVPFCLETKGSLLKYSLLYKCCLPGFQWSQLTEYYLCSYPLVVSTTFLPWPSLQVSRVHATTYLSIWDYNMEWNSSVTLVNFQDHLGSIHVGGRIFLSAITCLPGFGAHPAFFSLQAHSVGKCNQGMMLQCRMWDWGFASLSIHLFKAWHLGTGIILLLQWSTLFCLCLYSI